MSQIQGITDQEALRNVTIPPGACWRYAIRPEPMPLRGSRRRAPSRRETTMIQFAIGAAVVPEERAITRLTDRFRGRVIRYLAGRLSDDPGASWRTATREVRNQMALMTGKDGRGAILEGHRHTSFAVWLHEGRPARLVAWRASAFSADEEAAIHRAAMTDLSWAPHGSPANDEWCVRLVALDSAVAPPPGFDANEALVWRSVTPYVPPRHRFRKNGKPRESESVPVQVARELAARGISAEPVEVVEVGRPRWVSVHLPYRQRRSRRTLGDRLGFVLEIRFAHPVRGPLTLGHSASFGLGLFQPIE